MTVAPSLSHDEPKRRRAPVWDESAIRLIVISLRPREWIKNLIVFAGLIFGRLLLDVHADVRSTVAFGIFCLISSATYLINDIADREYDYGHPLKRHRPIAAGTLTVPTAIGVAGVLSAVALVGAAYVSRSFFTLAVAYATLFALYSWRLKHVVIIDVLVIAVGFVLRAAAGAAAVNVETSQWLLLCTLLLALFIVLGKRRHELVMLVQGAKFHRPSLGEYEIPFLDQMIAITAGATLIAYALYATSAETALKFGTRWLMLTIPFPIYGIFRYLYLIYRRHGGGSPADLLLSDGPLLTCVLLWVATAICIVYVAI